MGLWAFSLNIYSERASLCIICEHINLLLFSPHKSLVFSAPHTQKHKHTVYTQIYTISPLYCMSGCMADSTALMILHNVIMSLSQAWDVFAPFQVHSSRPSLDMYLVLVLFANNIYNKVWQKLFCKMTLAYLFPYVLQRYTWQNKSWHVAISHMWMLLIGSMKADVSWKTPKSGKPNGRFLIAHVTAML